MLNLKIRKYKFISLVLFLNLLAILFVYRSVFTLELEGDSWFYGWGHKIYYGSNVFSQLSLKGMKSSLAGASLTFGLIENHFGLNALAFYSISVILKFISVVVFYFLINKLTDNKLIALIASLLLSVTFVGIEATHWVFNMYAYIGLIFITLSILLALDLPTNFRFRKWLISFILACIGIWYATMRTSGIIPFILIWSIYKLMTIRTKDSKKNLVYWIVGFILFIAIDKSLLGQMESDYSRYYIIGQGIQAFQTQIANYKFDFLISSASNLGSAILPDTTWYSFNFPKLFSFLGSSTFNYVILPSFTAFSFIAWAISSLFYRNKAVKLWITSKFIFIFFLGLYWTIIVYLISTLGPLNFPSWVNLVVTLFGGYFMLICLFLLVVKDLPTRLKDLFFLTFIWSFVFLLLPSFQNGGPIFGTYHRYLVTTAPAVPMFIAGLITLGFLYKHNLFISLVLLIAFFIIFSHTLQTKAFFDRKALIHNREISANIWGQFTSIVPNKPQYAKNPPTLYFESADNALDQETLFENLIFGFNFLVDLRYGWDHNLVSGLYNNGNYLDLIKDVKKNPKLLDEFYGLRMENQSLVEITEAVKRKVTLAIQQ